MPIKITIPRLGWSMDEGIFAEWLKKPGDFVDKGEMVFMLEGEKSVQEVESFDAGFLHVPDDAPQPGDVVVVGQCIGFLLGENEEAPATIGPVSENQTADPVQTQPSRVPVARSRPVVPDPLPPPAGPAARRMARQLGIPLERISTPDPTGRIIVEDVLRATNQSALPAQETRRTAPIRSTPRARRRARQLGIDWTKLNGSGRGGRIRERDVVVPGETRTSADSAVIPTGGTLFPADRIRRTIAHRLQADRTVPVTLTSVVDASSLVAFRDALRSRDSGDPVPGFTELMLWLVAEHLQECPDLNACWLNDGIYRFDNVNLAFAVDTPRGLVTPVLRSADQLNLAQLTTVCRELVATARAGRLAREQLTGGTFTVSSLGMFGIDAFTPVINPPQAGILGIGRIREEPVVRDGQVVAGQTITLSLTFDHRVLDGAPAARWLQLLGQAIETVAEQNRQGG